jgi:hypothetical protein
MVGRPREQDDMDLGTWTKVRLQAALKAAGLSTNGSKEQLLERLQKATDNSKDGGREFEAGGPASGSASSAVMAADIVLIHDGLDAAAAAPTTPAPARLPTLTVTAHTLARSSSGRGPPAGWLAQATRPVPAAARPKTPMTTTAALAASGSSTAARIGPAASTPTAPRDDSVDDTEGDGPAGSSARQPNFTLNEWARIIHVMADPRHMGILAAAEGRTGWAQLDDPRDATRRDPWAADGPLTRAFNEGYFEDPYVGIRTDADGVNIDDFDSIDPEARPWPRTGETLRNKWNALKALFTTPYRRYETSGQNDPAAFPSFIPATLSDPERVRVLYMFHAFRDSASLEAVLKTVPGDVAAEEGVATPSAPSTPAVPSGGSNGGAGKRRRVDATQSGTSTGTAGGSADAAAAARAAAAQSTAAAALLNEERRTTQLQQLQMLLGMRNGMMASALDADQSMLAGINAEIAVLSRVLFNS